LLLARYINRRAEFDDHGKDKAADAVEKDLRELIDHRDRHWKILIDAQA
jgi:hypothetical protein